MRKDKVIEGVLESLKAEKRISSYAYDHFRVRKQGRGVATPFAIYRRVAVPSFGADDVAYSRDIKVDVEIYADRPDEMVEIMERIEAAFDAKELFWNKTADTVYIDTEDFYESLYEL